MAFDCLAIPTNEAKRRLAFMTQYGTAYRARYFGLGASGHNPLDPSIPLTVDPSATEMPGGAPLFGPEVIDAYLYQTDFCPIYSCRVLQGEYQGYVSTVALFAEIVYVGPDDPDPPVVGYQFLYAVCNRPLLTFSNLDAPTFNVTVYF